MLGSAAPGQRIFSVAGLLTAQRHVRAEVKVKYPTLRGNRHQLYTLDCFFYFPKELEAARLSGFYSDLWEVVRLHTPKVHCA